MNNKRNIIAIIVAAVCVGLVIATIINRNPNRVFTRVFGFKLPDSAEFVGYSKDLFSDDFEAKILISNNDVDAIRQGLNNYFGGEDNPIHDYSHTSHASWWDLDENNMISQYFTMYGIYTWFYGTTGYLWAFLAESEDGEYYLYIDK